MPAMPPPARVSDNGPPSVVVGVPSDATSRGGEMPAASAGAGGADTSAAAAHGTGGGSTAPGHGAAGDRGAGLGLGARGGSALALAVPGDGGGDGAADAIYDELRQRLQAALVYPPRARPRRLTGVVEVELEIQPSGAITRVVVAVSSSHPLLDDAAVDTVRGLGQVPFPPSIRPRVLRVRLPVEFAFH
jgi:TonB family protein